MKSIMFRAPMLHSLFNCQLDVWPAAPIDASRPVLWETRRLFRKQPHEVITTADVSIVEGRGGSLVAMWRSKFFDRKISECGSRYDQPPSQIFVKETYGKIERDGRTYRAFRGPNGNGMECYEITTDGAVQVTPDWSVEDFHWQGPLLLTERFARGFLTMRSIRHQRLQEITAADVIASGISMPGDRTADELIAEYRAIWDNINPDDRWEDNPMVWVYEVQRTSRKRT